MMRRSNGTVAQLVEQGPFKALVLGSSPSRPTIKSKTYANLSTRCTETVRKLTRGYVLTPWGGIRIHGGAKMGSRRPPACMMRQAASEEGNAKVSQKRALAPAHLGDFNFLRNVAASQLTRAFTAAQNGNVCTMPERGLSANTRRCPCRNACREAVARGLR